jgi:polyhydroxyalkanoate synthesis regulator phasin
MVFASSAFVFADNNSNLVDNMKSASLVRRAAVRTVPGRKHEDFKAVIDKLVEEGKLSREKAEQIEKFMQQKKEEQKNAKPEEKVDLRKGHKYGLVYDLVNSKIINDAEAEIIRGKFREIKEANMNEKLAAMVQKGTITQAQADKVKVYFEKVRKERVEIHKKLQNMTEEQRNAYFKEHKKDNFMDKLVEDGVLTKEQVQELRSSFKEGHKGKCKEH